VRCHELLKFQAEQHEFVHQQINLYSCYLKRRVIPAKARLDSIALGHGDTYVDGIQPIFEALKACHFDSSWNWVRKMLSLYSSTTFSPAGSLPSM
jgi:fatty acid synthase subunit alpha